MGPTAPWNDEKDAGAAETGVHPVDELLPPGPVVAHGPQGTSPKCAGPSAWHDRGRGRHDRAGTGADEVVGRCTACGRTRMTRLSDEIADELDHRLAGDDRELAERYTGDSGERQTVHRV